MVLFRFGRDQMLNPFRMVKRPVPYGDHERSTPTPSLPPQRLCRNGDSRGGAAGFPRFRMRVF